MPHEENAYNNTIRSTSAENQWEFALSINGDFSEINNESVSEILILKFFNFSDIFLIQ